jgi:hypothetical protein
VVVVSLRNEMAGSRARYRCGRRSPENLAGGSLGSRGVE